mmetsp:Transcript_12809/g.47341  ORF Transcript_12809/g.47341 Transcript_12809/m.47341 type:complete len:378 (+) Transcript_12809:1205-2338(+)
MNESACAFSATSPFSASICLSRLNTCLVFVSRLDLSICTSSSLACSSLWIRFRKLSICEESSSPFSSLSSVRDRETLSSKHKLSSSSSSSSPSSSSSSSSSSTSTSSKMLRRLRDLRLWDASWLLGVTGTLNEVNRSSFEILAGSAFAKRSSVSCSMSSITLHKSCSREAFALRWLSSCSSSTLCRSRAPVCSACRSSSFTLSISAECFSFRTSSASSAFCSASLRAVVAAASLPLSSDTSVVSAALASLKPCASTEALCVASPAPSPAFDTSSSDAVSDAGEGLSVPSSPARSVSARSFSRSRFTSDPSPIGSDRTPATSFASAAVRSSATSALSVSIWRLRSAMTVEGPAPTSVAMDRTISFARCTNLREVMVSE